MDDGGMAKYKRENMKGGMVEDKMDMLGLCVLLNTALPLCSYPFNCKPC